MESALCHWSCLVKCDESSVYSSWQRPCKFIKLSAVGGGHVSLTSYMLLWSVTSWKLRSFLEQIFLLLFRQPCVQFSLQATCPLKDYPHNTVKNFKRLNQALDRLDRLLTIHDDMVVYGVGDTEEEAMADHNKNLEQLLQRCGQKGVKLNEKKLKVMCKEWPYT